MTVAWDLPGPIDDVVLAPINYLGGKVKDAVDDLLADFFTWITGLLLDGVLWLFEVALGFISERTTPDVNAVWFVGGGGGTPGPYQICLWIGLTLMAMMLMLAIADYLWHRDGSAMLRTVAHGLPRAMFILTGLLTLTTWGIQVGELLSGWLMDSFGTGMRAFPDRIRDAAAAGEFGVGILVVAVLALLLMIVLLVLIAQLVIRQGFIYLATALTAAVVGLELYRPAKGASGKAIRLLIGLIAAKPVIALCFAIAGAAMGGSGYTSPPADQCVEDNGYRQCTVQLPDAALDEPANNPTPLTDAGFITATTSIGEESAGDLGPTVGAMLAGGAIMVLAVFAPSMVLRLFTVGDATTAAAGATALATTARKTANVGAAAATGGAGAALGAATGVSTPAARGGGAGSPSAATQKAAS